jgi:hypothetical protein
VFERVIKDIDIKVLEGHRGQAAQDRAFAEGNSRVKWPNGRHNVYPSRAVDVAPYPIDWSDDFKNLRRYYFMAGFVLAIASTMGIKLRWGAAWSDLSDGDYGDFNPPGKLNDFPHFELVD